MTFGDFFNFTLTAVLAGWAAWFVVFTSIRTDWDSQALQDTQATLKAIAGNRGVQADRQQGVIEEWERTLAAEGLCIMPPRPPKERLREHRAFGGGFLTGGLLLLV